MSRWIRRRRRDEYFRRAKDDGYLSRAAYKLLQINRRYRIFKGGDKVLDIGSAPGGWSQVAREFVGKAGLVVGADLEEASSLDQDNVVFVLGDIMEDSTLEKIRSVESEFNVIISDASPAISGVWSRDHLLSIDLARRALDLCDELLKDGGNFVVKVFQGEEIDDFHREVKRRFAFTRRSKPKASRGESSEIYIVGKGFASRPSE